MVAAAMQRRRPQATRDGAVAVRSLDVGMVGAGGGSTAGRALIGVNGFTGLVESA
jgi:hypothetical protein